MKNAPLRLALFLPLLLVLALGLSQAAHAQQFVYTPENPAFGGAAINYSWMLSSAEAQKRFEEEDRFGLFDRDPLQDFQQSLQRQILNELSRQVIRDRFGETLDLSQQGRYELGQYTVEITPGLDGVAIRIFDVFSGDETTITIPNI